MDRLQRENVALDGSQGETDATLNVMKSWSRYYESLIDTYERELEALPKGKMVRSKVHGFERVYHVLETKRIYLSNEKDAVLIEQLARKRFLRKSLVILRNNLKVLRTGLLNWKAYNPAEVCSDFPHFYSDFVRRYGLPVASQTMNQWLSEPVEYSEKYPEQLKIKTQRGEYVRSKSEALIANLLYSYGLMYRYEARLGLGDLELYPDFTIYRPSDGKIFYWEHFGMVFNEEYWKKMEWKLRYYNEQDINQWDNLIVTYDTKEGGIDIQQIEAIIRAMLLPIKGPATGVINK